MQVEYDLRDFWRESRFLIALRLNGLSLANKCTRILKSRSLVC